MTALYISSTVSDLILQMYKPSFFFSTYYADSSGVSVTLAEKEEADARSIYVGNVRHHHPVSL